MTEYYSLAQAKARLSEVVDKVEETQEHIVITRRGKPTALLMGVDEYEGLLETLDILGTPGAVDEIRKADKEIAEGEYVTSDELRREFLDPSE